MPPYGGAEHCQLTMDCVCLNGLKAFFNIIFATLSRDMIRPQMPPMRGKGLPVPFSCIAFLIEIGGKNLVDSIPRRMGSFYKVSELPLSLISGTNTQRPAFRLSALSPIGAVDTFISDELEHGFPSMRRTSSWGIRCNVPIRKPLISPESSKSLICWSEQPHRLAKVLGENTFPVKILSLLSFFRCSIFE